MNCGNVMLTMRGILISMKMQILNRKALNLKTFMEALYAEYFAKLIRNIKRSQVNFRNVVYFDTYYIKGKA